MPSVAGGDSLFGLFVAVLPGLGFFRYPGKFLVFTALALSALAGLGWDRVASGISRRRVISITWGLLILTAVSLVAAAGFRDRLVSAMRGSRHSLFGPIDAPGAVAEMVWGFGHGLVALASALIVVVWCPRRPVSAGLAALALLTADLAWANARQVIAIPQADYEHEPEVLRAIHNAERRPNLRAVSGPPSRALVSARLVRDRVDSTAARSHRLGDRHARAGLRLVARDRLCPDR